MKAELEAILECDLDEEDIANNDEHEDRNTNARLSLLKQIPPECHGNCGNSYPFQPVHEGLLNVEEYLALQTLSIARNYDGIAHAQAEKPKRQLDSDVKIPEQPLYEEGTDGTAWGGEGQIENLGDSKTAILQQTFHLAHIFEKKDLDDILSYNIAEKNRSSWKI